MDRIEAPQLTGRSERGSGIEQIVAEDYLVESGELATGLLNRSWPTGYDRADYLHPGKRARHQLLGSVST